METPLILQALQGKRTERVPIWFMRQAGRYLEEYRALRAKHRMLDMIRSPELAAEVTLQPLRRFEFDAAIIFADILNPLIGMGINVDFIEGEGPKIFNPPRTRADIDALKIPDPQSNVGYTLAAINTVRRDLEARNIPVLGFAGAPFTLSLYLLDQGNGPDYDGLKRFMWSEADAWVALQKKLIAMLADYLAAQAQAGASALQIFDSWAGILSPTQYSEFVLPYLQELFAAVRARTAVPLVYFSTGTAGLFPLLPEIGADAYSIDWRSPLGAAHKALGAPRCLQGNLDPHALFAAPERLAYEVQAVLAESKNLDGFIFNLGHGILQKTPVENVAEVIRLVHGTRRH